MDSEQGEPLVLPGRTAGDLLWRSLRWPLLGTACLPGVVVQAYVPWQAGWVAGWLAVGAVAVVQWVRTATAASRRERAEVARGYTTVLAVARDRPDLLLVHPYSRRPLAQPWAPRPSRLPPV